MKRIAYVVGMVHDDRDDPYLIPDDAYISEHIPKLYDTQEEAEEVAKHYISIGADMTRVYMLSRVSDWKPAIEIREAVKI